MGMAVFCCRSPIRIIGDAKALCLARLQQEKRTFSRWKTNRKWIAPREGDLFRATSVMADLRKTQRSTSDSKEPETRDLRNVIEMVPAFWRGRGVAATKHAPDLSSARGGTGKYLECHPITGRIRLRGIEAVCDYRLSQLKNTRRGVWSQAISRPFETSAMASGKNRPHSAKVIGAPGAKKPFDNVIRSSVRGKPGGGKLAVPGERYGGGGRSKDCHHTWTSSISIECAGCRVCRSTKNTGKS